MPLADPPVICRKEITLMLKTECFDCWKLFNPFEEGHSSQYVTVCGECWKEEQKRRKQGGVFTREEKE